MYSVLWHRKGLQIWFWMVPGELGGGGCVSLILRLRPSLVITTRHLIVWSTQSRLAFISNWTGCCKGVRPYNLMNVHKYLIYFALLFEWDGILHPLQLYH